MKFHAPEGLGSIWLDGAEFAPDENSAIDVPDRFETTLISHGYVRWNYGVSNPAIETMTHSQLVLLVVERTRQTLEQMPSDELRARLLATNPATVILPDEANGAGAGDKIHAESVAAGDIDAMNRPQLFAFLKAKGVVVSPPIGNGKLREIAYETIGVKGEPSAVDSPET